MDFIKKIEMSKEKVTLWTNVMSGQDTRYSEHLNKVIDTISVEFEGNVQAFIKLYNSFNENSLFVNGHEVDCFELTDEFYLGKYTFHDEDNGKNYTVILEEEKTL